MKTLVEALREHLGYQINEDFDSDILRTTFIDNPTNKQIFKMHQGIAKELKWDQISDNDVEKIDTEQAGKLAYQRRDVPAYILWFDRDDQMLARTISNNDIKGGIRSPWANVRKVQQAAAYAIIIKDYTRFDTTELKRQRAEAKKGALAFMTDKEILQKNLKRYQEKLVEIKADKFKYADYIEKTKTIVSNFANMIQCIPEDFVPENWSTFSNNFNNLAREASDIMSYMSMMTNDNEAIEYGKAHGERERYSKEHLNRNIDFFNKSFNKFCTMYDIALTGERVERW